jgi:anti-sigma regulatory factor (Ser/Thr protein kinase)
MREDVAWYHELLQPADPRTPARVREFVAHHLQVHDRPHLVEPVRLVASELATNAVLHSGTDLLVTLLEEQGMVVLSVEDFRPHRWPSLEVAAATAERGRGLWIVEVLSEDWGVRTEARGSKAIWASFPAHADEPEALGCSCRATHPAAGNAGAARLSLVSPER